MNAIRRGVRFLTGFGAFIFWTWAVIGLIRGEDTTTQVAWLIPCFAVYFMLDTRLRLEDLEKRMTAQEETEDTWIIDISTFVRPPASEPKPKPETKEGKETT